MKTILSILMFLVATISSNAQTPASTVYDPINGATLVSMGTTLAMLKNQGAEVVKTFESANQIKQAAKIMELIAAIEDSYCIIQDLDLYNTRAQALFRTQRNCYDSFEYSLCISAIQTAMQQTTMAATSTNMSLGERSNTISNSFKSIKDSNSDLNQQKEKLKKKVEGRETMKKSLNSLNAMM